MSLKILHIGDCCSGNPQRLADAMGSELVTFLREHPFGYRAKNEYNLNIFPNHAVISRILSLPKMLSIVKNYDLLHFHCFTILPCSIDLPLWKAMGKKIYIHYRGSDIRNLKYIYRVTPARWADRLIVSTPDLLKVVPEAEWIPNPLDVQNFPYVDEFIKDDKRPLRVLHAPSNPTTKGTHLIHKGVKMAQKAGYPIIFECLTGKSHARVLKAMQQADIIIDQMIAQYGVYGVISCEAMAMGKPVICSINEEYDHVYNGCPILPTRNDDPAEIAAHLINLAENAEYRYRLGKEGRKYMERTHDTNIIINRLYQTGECLLGT